MQNRCNAVQEYSYAKTDTPNSEAVTIAGWNAIYASCTFLIKATSGAPGFNLNSQAPTGSIYAAAWIEYDLDEVTVYDVTEWPALDMEFAEAQPCNSNEGCIQGDLWVRTKIVSGGT